MHQDSSMTDMIFFDNIIGISEMLKMTDPRKMLMNDILVYDGSKDVL